MEQLNLKYLQDPETFAVNLLPSHSDHRFGEKEAKWRLFSLNGKWEFARAQEYDPSLMGYLDANKRMPRKMPVPSSVEPHIPSELNYTNLIYPWDGHTDVDAPEVDMRLNPVNIYRKRFALPKRMREKRIVLRFSGFETAIYVYLNGRFVGYSERLYVDSEFDITPYIQKKNILVVYNFSRASSSWILDQDFWRFSGIFRDVTLIALSRGHIEDVSAKTDLTEDYKRGVLSLSGKVEGEGAKVACSLKWKGKEMLSASVDVKDSRFAFDETIVPSVKPWSPHRPNLYALDLTLLDRNGAAIESATLDIGFTKEEVKDGVWFLNGKRLVIKGVNRHEINMRLGRHTPEEDIDFDVRLLKKFNFNAVRTSHYPNDSHFYGKCDRLGLMVVDECCIESHGRWASYNHDPSKWIPGSDPRWEAIALDRAQSMYERDKNHPSIIAWSLGNESAGGSNFIKNVDYFHSVDRKRLVHYEGGNYDEKLDAVLDMHSFMYKKPNDLEAFLQTHKDKPVIECEFAHAMGQSCGNFEEYTHLMERYPHYAGGFVWDYIDQAILVDTDEGPEFFYGGDAGEHPNSKNFNCNGILFADRKEALRSPKLHDIAHWYSPIQIAFAGDGIDIAINDEDYTPKDFKLSYSVLVDGQVAKETAILYAGEKHIALPLFSEPLKGEIIRRISASFGESSYVIDDGDSVFTPSSKAKKEPAAVHQGASSVGVDGEGYSLFFGLYGHEIGLASAKVRGYEILKGIPRLTFWRPSTDNDRGNGFVHSSKRYFAFSKWARHMATEVNDGPDGSKCIRYKYALDETGAEAEVSYAFGLGNCVDVGIRYKGAAGMPSMPCFGIDLPFDANAIGKIEAYGHGPYDTYSDSLGGGSACLYETNARDNLLPYSIPQECGHKMGTRFVELYLRNDDVVRIEAIDHPFSYKLLPFDEFQIEAASHYGELMRTKSDASHLTIYAAMRGIGGDDSWGAPVHEEYEVSGEGEYALSFRLVFEKKGE